MLPPAFQSHLAQLAAVGLQMHRMAVSADLSGAMTAAREALALLQSEDLRAAVPDLPALDAISSRFGTESTGNPQDLRNAIAALSRLIQSLGASPHPFLAIVQNAPDQKPRVAEPANDLGESDIEPRSSTVLGALEQHWNLGEHARAKAMVEGLILSAREGNLTARGQLAELVCSERPTISVNLRVVADVLEETQWTDFALQLIDPHRPFLIPGLRPSRINPHLLSALLDRPPAIADSAVAITSMLRRKNGHPAQGAKDTWGLKTRASQGLFTLTAPGRKEILSVADFWKILEESWPAAVPSIRPEWFGVTPEGQARWDLYEEHLHKAFEIIENPRLPRNLREAALRAVWSGGPARGPKALCLTVCARTLDLVETSDWAWTIVESPLEELARSGDVASERLRAALDGRRTFRRALPSDDPVRLTEELAAFVGEKAFHLRVVSPNGPGAAASSMLTDKLRRVTAIAEVLNARGTAVEANLVADVMKKGLESLVFVEGSSLSLLSKATDDFRRALYALHPAAAVTAWLNVTGAPWPSQALPHGHRLEGALALLRWVLDREKEPEELKVETANYYWDIDTRFCGRVWRPTTSAKPSEWWKHRLEQELSATLARQLRHARQKGAPGDWLAFARNRPEVTDDLHALSQSSHSGTHILAEHILEILSLT